MHRRCPQLYYCNKEITQKYVSAINPSDVRVCCEEGGRAGGQQKHTSPWLNYRLQYIRLWPLAQREPEEQDAGKTGAFVAVSMGFNWTLQVKKSGAGSSTLTKKRFSFPVRLQFQPLVKMLWKMTVALAVMCVGGACNSVGADVMSRLIVPRDYGVKLCGREFIRAVIFTCGGSRWKRSTEGEGGESNYLLCYWDLNLTVRFY